ncbi:TPA: peptidylprolyl isomerase [Citrobacter freundii]|nr:peptidylprolyl isomerase [Citrobacter freundii]
MPRFWHISRGISLLFLFRRDLSSFPRQHFTGRGLAVMLPATFYIR